MFPDHMQERLQKIIARAGVTSRRKAEALIVAGEVTVNGNVITELGAKADPDRDHIKVRGRLLQPEPLEYVILNKPRGVISAVSDPEGRPVVTDYVKSRVRLYPAGRLDFESEGLVLLTNDGELVRKVTTSGILQKTYRVKISGSVGESQLERMRRGLRLESGEVYAPCEIQVFKPGNNAWYQVVLKQGRNRQIRRMFEGVGSYVLKLRRMSIGPIEVSPLAPGQWRHLTEREVHRLKRAAGQPRTKRG